MLLLDIIKRWLGLTKAEEYLPNATANDLADALFGKPEQRKECERELVEMRAKLEEESAVRRAVYRRMTEGQLTLAATWMTLGILSQFNRPANDLLEEIESRIGVDPSKKKKP